MRIRLRQQRLKEAHPAAVEALSAPGHIETPYPIGPLVGNSDDFLVTRLEIGDPCPQRAHIVLTQILDIADLEADPFGDRIAVGDRDEIAVGEDVAIDESAGADPASLRGLIGDPMIEKEPAGSQRGKDRFEIALQPRTTDVFDHPDAHDLIEDLVAQLPIVAQLDLGTPLEAE